MVRSEPGCFLLNSLDFLVEVTKGVWQEERREAGRHLEGLEMDPTGTWRRGHTQALAGR